MLDLKTRKIGRVLVLDCEGSIIYGEEATLLRKTVKELLPEHHEVVLGLAEVRMVDSNGLGALVGLLGSAQAVGGQLKLAALGTRVKNALMVAKLAQLFQIYPSVEAAVEAFRLEDTPIAVAELGR